MRPLIEVFDDSHMIALCTCETPELAPDHVNCPCMGGNTHSNFHDALARNEGRLHHLIYSIRTRYPQAHYFRLALPIAQCPSRRRYYPATPNAQQLRFFN